MSCIILLGQGKRTSACEGLTVKMVEAALIQNQKKDSQGNDVVVINSSSHKTGKKYYEIIVLHDYSLDFFRRYAQTIRPAIVNKQLLPATSFSFRRMVMSSPSILRHPAS